jgi:hypothetical protein
VVKRDPSLLLITPRLLIPVLRLLFHLLFSDNIFFITTLTVAIVDSEEKIKNTVMRSGLKPDLITERPSLLMFLDPYFSTLDINTTVPIYFEMR